MVRYTLQMAAALAALVLAGSSAGLLAGDTWSPSRVEIKRGGAGENNPSRAPAKPALKIMPFAEDEAEARQPVKVQPRQSDFRPRFKSPGIRQTQPAEPAKTESAGRAIAPVEETAPSEPEAESVLEVAEPAPQQPSAPADSTSAASGANGKDLVGDAFAKSKQAKTEAEYTEVIDLCRRGMEVGLKPSFEQYARNLMAWSYNRRGEERAKAGRDKEALADFEKAVTDNPKQWRAIHNRGVSRAALGQADGALKDFDRTIELNQKYPNAYFNRGEVRYQLGEFEGALDDYDRALELGIRDAAIWNSRGHCFYRMKRFGEAIRDYGEAIRQDPKYAAALINRGDVFTDLGRYGDAAQDYREAVRTNPKLGRAYQRAAWLMATCPDEHYRDEKLAVEAAQKAIALDGETYRGLETLAAAEASANLFAKAKATQEKAIALAPRPELVTAEKRMSIYQRDLAYRELPRKAFTPPEERDTNVRQATATAPVRPKGRPNPRSRY